MKVASLQYSYDFPKDFDGYQQKISKLIEGLADQKVNFVLFPEYAGLEMLSFTEMKSLPNALSAYMNLFQELSQKHRLYICSGSQVAKTTDGTFNRSFLFAPSGKVAHQDKCILIPEEVKEELFEPGKKIGLFETEFGKVGICVCYDVEFPSLVKKLVNAGANIIFVPAYTSTVHGYYRVFLSCRARALENQCFVVQSSLVGLTDVEMAYGASAICCPIDGDFPEDGLLALGKRDQTEVVISELDLKRLEKVRTHGTTRNFTDGKKLEERSIPLESTDLR